MNYMKYLKMIIFLSIIASVIGGAALIVSCAASPAPDGSPAQATTQDFDAFTNALAGITNSMAIAESNSGVSIAGSGIPLNAVTLKTGIPAVTFIVTNVTVTNSGSRNGGSGSAIIRLATSGSAAAPSAAISFVFNNYYYNNTSKGLNGSASCNIGVVSGTGPEIITINESAAITRDSRALAWNITDIMTSFLQQHNGFLKRNGQRAHGRRILQPRRTRSVGRAHSFCELYDTYYITVQIGQNIV